jgi:PadR family transcriptional regulator PadR
MYKKIMYTCPMYSKELIKGTLKTIVLKLLSETDSMYGYEITQKVKGLSGGKIVITEGALYPLLHKLEAEKVLITDVQIVNGRQRKYYRLTRDGKNTAQLLVDEFVDFLGTMKGLIDTAGGYAVS